MKMNYSKMRSESSEYTWKAKVILIHLENYLEESAQDVWMHGRHAKDIWERNRMDPDMHTTWWNVGTQKQMEMVPRAFREQSEQNDQMDTVRTPVNLILEALRE